MCGVCVIRRKIDASQARLAMISANRRGGVQTRWRISMRKYDGGWRVKSGVNSLFLSCSAYNDVNIAS